MRVQPPFLYHGPRPQEIPSSPYHGFDPKPVYRNSLSSVIPQSGPSDLNNELSNSYVFLPKNKINAYPVTHSAKRNVNYIRKGLLFLRSCELICSSILFIVSIIANPTQKSTAWVIRIVPVIATIHTTYALYYLSCKETARAKIFSKYCSLFATSDAVTIPFYIYMATFFLSRPIDTGLMDLEDIHINLTLSYQIGFYVATIGASLHFVSCAISLYLGRIFSMITKMPPDMNPMEENLTSRHIRKKSSITTLSLISPKRDSVASETKRNSEPISEVLNDQSAIHFREIQYKPDLSPNGNTPYIQGGRQSLPSRRPQIPFSHNKPKGLKRSSCYKSLSKRPNYAEIIGPDEDDRSNTESYTQCHSQPQQAKWQNTDSLSTKHRNSRNMALKKIQRYYLPLEQRQDISNDHPNPLQANPPFTTPLSPSPRRKLFSPHASEIVSPSPIGDFSYSDIDSGDIGDASLESIARKMDLESPESSPRYGDLGLSDSPIMVGQNKTRQVSSGNDYILADWNTSGKYGRLENNGTLLEETRESYRPSRIRPRKFSGKFLF